MGTYHSLTAGTDKTNEAFRVAALASVNIVAFLAIVLILAVRRAAVARAAVTTGASPVSAEVAADAPVG